MNPESSPGIAASPLAGCLSHLELDRAGGSGTATLCCPPDFLGFAGHFPDEPILPAVVQLMAVRLLAETLAAHPLAAVAVERLKFKGMVRPGEAIAVRLKLREQGDRLRGDFSLTREAAVIASGALIFQAAGGEG